MTQDILERECADCPQVTHELAGRRQAGAGRPLLAPPMQPTRDCPLRGARNRRAVSPRRLTQARIAATLAVCKSTVGRVLALGAGCGGLTSLSPASLLCATSMLALGSCSSWTPTSLHASSGLATASPGIGATRWQALGGVSLRGHR
jgi:hypothetical protein